MSILDTVSQNLCTKKTGKRYSTTSKDFYEVLLMMGGPRLGDFLSQRLDGPQIHSAMFWRNDNAITYVLGEHKQNIEAIVKLYKNAKEMMSLSTMPVPYIKAEDETAIISQPEYKSDTDKVWGFCGRKGPDHICEESFIVNVGDEDGAYQWLLDAFQTCQVATHARVIMIHWLHQKLPRVILLLQANCNRFTQNEVLHQWLVLDALCEHVRSCAWTRHCSCFWWWFLPEKAHAKPVDWCCWLKPCYPCQTWFYYVSQNRSNCCWKEIIYLDW